MYLLQVSVALLALKLISASALNAEILSNLPKLPSIGKSIFQHVQV